MKMKFSVGFLRVRVKRKRIALAIAQEAWSPLIFPIKNSLIELTHKLKSKVQSAWIQRLKTFSKGKQRRAALSIEQLRYNWERKAEKKVTGETKLRKAQRMETKRKA